MIVIRELAEIVAIHELDTEVLAASIRHPLHMTQAALAGAAHRDAAVQGPPADGPPPADRQGHRPVQGGLGPRHAKRRPPRPRSPAGPNQPRPTLPSPTASPRRPSRDAPGVTAAPDARHVVAGPAADASDSIRATSPARPRRRITRAAIRASPTGAIPRRLHPAYAPYARTRPRPAPTVPATAASPPRSRRRRRPRPRYRIRRAAGARSRPRAQRPRRQRSPRDERHRARARSGASSSSTPTTGERKDDLVDRILQRQTERAGHDYASGILDIVDEGFGFMRRHGLLPSPDDVYVSSSQVRRFGLRIGDRVSGAVRAPARGARSTGACSGSTRSTASTPRPPAAGRSSTT